MTKKIRVGIVDTGIQNPDHPAIKNNIVSCANFSYDGRKSTDILSSNSHGQAVASVITRVAPESELVIVKTLDDLGVGTPDNVANGIRYCIAVGCDIINCSVATHHSRKLEEAVKLANNKGVIVVAASGNDGKATKYYPACYHYVVAVGAMNNNGKKADFSSRNEFVDILAPGVDIEVAYGKDGYTLMSGTSFATSFITGKLALLKEQYRELNSEELLNLLKQLDDK